MKLCALCSWPSSEGWVTSSLSMATASPKTAVPFAAEADIPSSWECRVCGATALLRNGASITLEPGSQFELSGAAKSNHTAALAKRRRLEVKKQVGQKKQARGRVRTRLRNLRQRRHRRLIPDPPRRQRRPRPHRRTRTLKKPLQHRVIPPSILSLQYLYMRRNRDLSQYTG